MAKLLTDLRNSLWFVPTVIVLSAAALALGAVELDSIVGRDVLSRFPRFFGVGAAGARELLSAIAGSTITVTGVVFSITIVALSLTAAQYSPRVLRNFMADRPNQVVLGVFVGVYVYCLLVLRTVRGGEDSFIPGISIVVALVLALVSIGLLIFFIHHIALSIQVSHIAARIHRETMGAIRAVYPTRLEEAQAPVAEPSAWSFIAAEGTGYIQQIDIDRLAGAARGAGRVARMEKAVGEFVIAGHALIAVSGDDPPEREVAQALRSAYAINTYRDIRQDPGFGVQQLVDIALKALSPGVNDVGTARNILHYLSAVLCELAGRAVEEERFVFCDGALAVVKRGCTFDQFLDSAFGAMRRDAIGRPDMTVELLSALRELSQAARAPARRAAVLKQVHAIREALDSRELVSADSAAVRAAIQRVLAEPPASRQTQRT
jgi:uncharacterized membrane protein